MMDGGEDDVDLTEGDATASQHLRKQKHLHLHKQKHLHLRWEVKLLMKEQLKQVMKSDGLIVYQKDGQTKQEFGGISDYSSTPRDKGRTVLILRLLKCQH